MSNERPKVEQVTTAKVLPPKKSFWSDVLKPFIFDTVLPIVQPLFKEGVRAIGDAIMDAVLNDARPPQRQPQQRSNTPYHSYSRSTTTARKPVGNNRVVRVVLTDRREASNIIDKLQDIIDQYEVATVADLYSLVGLPSKYVDNDWGWDDIGAPRTVKVDGGFQLVLPDPIFLDS